jgi:hypothetical protein
MASDLPKFALSRLKKHTHTHTSDTHARLPTSESGCGRPAARARARAAAAAHARVLCPEQYSECAGHWIVNTLTQSPSK